MLRRSPGVGYPLGMHRSAVPAATLWLALIGCQPEQTERTREVVEQGVEQAKQGVEQGVEHAKEGVEQGVEHAKDGVESAKQGIADARERYEVDERVAEAREHWNTGMDEAADTFAELAEAGKEGAANVSAAIDEKSKAGIEGAAEAIKCKPDPAKQSATRCNIGEDLLAKLKDEPKLLAREIMLLPKQGETGQGLELVRLGRKSVPELLGLNRRDILLELNGVSLGSLDAIRSVDEALAGKPEAEIVYERDGERKTLVLVPE
jgi:type II secretory pathway component PulC